MFHRPVCAKCECEMRPERNGVGLLDMFNPSDKPDLQPYQLWDADLYKCPKCGCEIVTGFGCNAIAQHWEENDQLARTITGYERRSRIIKNYQ